MTGGDDLLRLRDIAPADHSAHRRIAGDVIAAMHSRRCPFVASVTLGTRARRYWQLADAAGLLQEAKELASAGSLIPAEMSYRDQLNRFKAQTARAGIDRVHGLRHHYAQTRYAELTGWKSPAAGGPASKQLSSAQKVIDWQARQTISRELGHEREQITAVYLGR